MKNIISKICYSIIVLSILIQAQEKDKEIIGSWEYQTMTTIYFSEPKEIITTDKSSYYQETFTFRKDGSFSVRGIYEGFEDAELGIWETNNGALTLNMKKEKTIGKYKINENILTLIIDEKETDEYYSSNSVLKYKKMFIGSKAY